MTKHEIISQLLRLSSRLEAQGNVIDALACSMAAAELMLHPAKGSGSEIDAAVAEAQRNIKVIFDRFQIALDKSNQDFEGIIRNAFPEHGGNR